MSKSLVRRSSLGCNIASNFSECQMNRVKIQGGGKKDTSQRYSSKRRYKNFKMFDSKNLTAFFPFLFLTLWFKNCNHAGAIALPVGKHVSIHFDSYDPGIDNGMKTITRRHYRKDEPIAEMDFTIFKHVGEKIICQYTQFMAISSFH